MLGFCLLHWHCSLERIAEIRWLIFRGAICEPVKGQTVGKNPTSQHADAAFHSLRSLWMNNISKLQASHQLLCQPSPDFPAYLLRSHHLQFLLYLLFSFVLPSNIYLIYLIFHLSFSQATGGKPNSSERPDMSYFAFQSVLRWTGGWRHVTLLLTDRNKMWEKFGVIKKNYQKIPVGIFWKTPEISKTGTEWGLY